MTFSCIRIFQKSLINVEKKLPRIQLRRSKTAFETWLKYTLNEVKDKRLSTKLSSRYKMKLLSQCFGNYLTIFTSYKILNRLVVYVLVGWFSHSCKWKRTKESILVALQRKYRILVSKGFNAFFRHFSSETKKQLISVITQLQQDNIKTDTTYQEELTVE